MKTSVDRADIIAKIEDVVYTVLPNGRTTVCSITMRNGYTVNGEASCVLKSNFDAALGRKYSYEAAIDKLWPLEGYLLAERLHNTDRGDTNHDIGWAVQQMKNGKGVYRRGWNGKGQFVYFVAPGVYPAVSEAAKQFIGDNVPYDAYFALFNVSRELVSTWAPSGSDAMAQDWEILT